MKAKLIRRLSMGSGHPDYVPGKKQWVEAGEIVEGPQMYRLVLNGEAVEADEECKAAVIEWTKRNRPDWNRQEAIEARDAIHIAQEDKEAFRNGEMLGYNADGSWIPGPNYTYTEDGDE